MRTSIVLALVGIFGLVAQAKNLDQVDSPSAMFEQNAEAREAFVDKIKADPKLTAEQKAAYIALVNPQDGVRHGDGLLQKIDGATLKWFYSGTVNSSEGEQIGDGPEKLYDTALLGPVNLKKCLRFRLCVYVSKANQRMTVFYGGQVMVYNKKKGDGKPIQFANIPVSTAAEGSYTPTGLFSIGEIADRDRTSTEYPGAPLAYGMQLHEDIFIHGTALSNYKNLGRPASHGCIRTTVEVAGILNFMMRQMPNKERNIRVVVTEE